MARLRWKSISVCEFWPVLRSFRQSFAPLISHSLPHAVLPPSSSQAAVEVYFNCEVWLVFRSFKQSFVPSIRPSLLQSLCGNGSPSLHQLRVYSLRSTFCFRALSESLSLGPHLQRSQYTLHKTIGRPRLIKESKVWRFSPNYMVLWSLKCISRAKTYRSGCYTTPPTPPPPYITFSGKVLVQSKYQSHAVGKRLFVLGGLSQSNHWLLSTPL